ncbi:MAG: HlyC/CorC family transporter [Candidatus Acididesulfobacter diazotrophicus]|uniref:HlyC/CorC family transporter n=1 Tax=Candidatus Acididesulfobacter diazotrophicus TaxID=2597226 RepID=A0A519BNP0_9DELT|nr:MAG: HlyC/CorC family transporter [Candidatus Acididesulfobacter diazotrophicus]
MMNNDYILNLIYYFIIIIIAIFFEGFFAGSEIGIISYDKIKIKHIEIQGNKLAGFLIKKTKNPENTFATTLIGNNISNTTATIIATTALFEYVHKWTPFVVAILLTPFMIIFGEIIPKMVYRKYANTLMLKSIPFIVFFSILFYPINLIFIGLSKILNIIFKGKSKKVFLTKDELIKVLTISGNIGELKNYEKKIIKRIFEFGKKTAKDIMIPLINIVAIEESTSLIEAHEIILESNYSRIPVFKDRVDNILGIAFAFDIYNKENNNKIIKDIAKPVLFIPETLNISVLMVRMQKSHQQASIVVDEYGGAAGLITFEDILEEIVGEIRDETDEEEFMYKKIGEDTYIVNTRLSLEALGELLNIKINNPEETDYETISGLIMDRLGRIPAPGERFLIDNMQFTVTKATNKSVKEVTLTYLP